MTKLFLWIKKGKTSKNILYFNREIEDEPYVDYSILPYSLNEYDINIFTTLGCPFRCTYCQDGQMPYLEHRLDGGLGMIQEQLAPGKLVHFLTVR